MCLNAHIYVCCHIYYHSKVFVNPQKFLFLILKLLFLMKQVKHLNGFIYYTKYNLNQKDIKKQTFDSSK